MSENPWNFAERIAEAFNGRKACEAGLRYNLYVDCMPMYGIEDVDDGSFQRMSQFSMSTPGLKAKNRCVQELNKMALYAACRLGHNYAKLFSICP